MTLKTADLRPFDLEHIPQVVNLWNQAAGEVFPLRDIVLHQRIGLNPNYRPEDAVTAWRGDELIGFALITRYRGSDQPAMSLAGHAWVTLVVVAPAFQRQGIGTRMVRSLLERVDLPQQQLHAGAGLFFLFPGPPQELASARPFFESLGLFSKREVYDLRVDLNSPESRPVFDVPGQLAARGLTATVAQLEDVPAFLDFLAAEFPGGWWHDTNWYFANGGDPAGWLLMKDGDRVIGMSRLHQLDANLVGAAMFWSQLRGPGAGGLGPIGVAASRRGEGLGKLLLAAVLEELRGRGVDDVIADWTDLLGYYGQFGFKIWKRYWS